MKQKRERERETERESIEVDLATGGVGDFLAGEGAAIEYHDGLDVVRAKQINEVQTKFNPHDSRFTSSELKSTAI